MKTKPYKPPVCKNCKTLYSKIVVEEIITSEYLYEIQDELIIGSMHKNFHSELVPNKAEWYCDKCNQYKKLTRQESLMFHIE